MYQSRQTFAVCVIRRQRSLEYTRTHIADYFDWDIIVCGS